MSFPTFFACTAQDVAVLICTTLRSDATNPFPSRRVLVIQIVDMNFPIPFSVSYVLLYDA